MNRERDEAVFLGAGENAAYLALAMANRHGLIAGATGTGKTVTLQVLAEGLSRAGVSVFAADIKGDLAGLAMAGEASKAMAQRADAMGIGYAPEGFPVVFWDVFGEDGHPVRATISEMGPLMLARLLDVNDTQEGVLNIAFRVADEEGLLLLDLKDLRAILTLIGEHAAELTARYGTVSKASIGAIQRQLLVLENQGAARFFGEPALSLKDFLGTGADGRGRINILSAQKLMEAPRVYAAFLLWLLSELFEALPEAGDLAKPKLCFFFDEAHLLFSDAPKALLDRIEQVVRLIRSKGVGVYFVTQNPQDVPDKVLSQLGNRVQHALRAFAPRDQKAVKAAAETFRPNPALDTARAITELSKGEAIVSCLDVSGAPSMAERIMIRPPCSRLGPISPEERKQVMAASPIRGKYEQAIDSQSAYEVLASRMEGSLAPGTSGGGETEGGGLLDGIGTALGAIFGTGKSRKNRLSSGQLVARSVTRSVVNQVAGKVAADIGRQLGGSVGGTVGRAIVRGALGGILRRR